jgi:hypothetical protein
MTGIPGLNPGTMNFSGSYIDWAKYSDIAQAGDAGLRAGHRPPRGREAGPRKRSLRLTERVAGEAESPCRSLTSCPPCDHVGGGQVGSITRLLWRQHFLLRTIWPTYV